MSEYKEASKGIAFVIMWVLIGLLVFGAVSAAAWGISVALSGPKGAGDGVIRKNSADNWLDAQARFVENHAEYESTLVRIDIAYAAWQVDLSDKTLHQTYLGTIGYCTQVVADYNADAQNYLREDFRKANLPDHIDPATCKESNQ